MPRRNLPPITSRPWLQTFHGEYDLAGNAPRRCRPRCAISSGLAESAKIEAEMAGIFERRIRQAFEEIPRRQKPRQLRVQGHRLAHQDAGSAGADPEYTPSRGCHRARDSTCRKDPLKKPRRGRPRLTWADHARGPSGPRLDRGRATKSALRTQKQFAYRALHHRRTWLRAALQEAARRLGFEASAETIRTLPSASISLRPDRVRF